LSEEQKINFSTHTKPEKKKKKHPRKHPPPPPKTTPNMWFLKIPIPKHFDFIFIDEDNTKRKSGFVCEK